MDYAKDIILSSRISLKRNLKGYDFPSTMTYEESLTIIDIFRSIFGEKLLLISEVDDATIDKLVDEGILSNDAKDKLVKVALVFEGDCTLVINDLDHLSINISSFGLDLTSAYKRVLEIEKVLDEHLDFAFSPSYGYLTSKARDTGLGLDVAIKLFLFGMIDSSKSFFAFKQTLFFQGLFIKRFKENYQKASLNDVYMLRNYGNYRQDMDQYVEKFEANLQIIVKNERKFRRNFKPLNNIEDRDIEENIDIITNNLKNNLYKSIDKILNALYALKKYNILGFKTGLGADEIDYLIKNITKAKYVGNVDPKRSDFLNTYIGEVYGKQ